VKKLPALVRRILPRTPAPHSKLLAQKTEAVVSDYELHVRLPLLITVIGPWSQEVFHYEANKVIIHARLLKKVRPMSGLTIWKSPMRSRPENPASAFTPDSGYRPDGECRANDVEIEGERVLARLALL